MVLCRYAKYQEQQAIAASKTLQNGEVQTVLRVNDPEVVKVRLSMGFWLVWGFGLGFWFGVLVCGEVGLLLFMVHQ